MKGGQAESPARLMIVMKMAVSGAHAWNRTIAF